MNILLDRDTFRNGVFMRDKNKCVICGQPAQDAHHIIERRLFDDGGYYLANGASLCATCHIKAESTEISCEEIRTAAGITDIILPLHLYRDNVYDKWGNIININGTRLKGELFGDESVQKILKQGGVLSKFVDYVKYPRTYHLPWSEGLTNDDRVMTPEDLQFLEESSVVATEKMDGENTTIYSDYIHARSVDSRSHWTQSYVRQLQSKIGHDIPKGWRICGENLYAKHSIKYDKLEDFFLMFSIWDDKNQCLSWLETVEWAKLLGLKVVDVFFVGPCWKDTVHRIYKGNSKHKTIEGYVVRTLNGFSYGSFRKCTGKFVRKNHVQTSHHWRFEKIEKNELSSVG
jgi:hypothetical protein